MTLPTFNPHGLHGFTTYANRGRIKHLPTFNADQTDGIEYQHVDTTPHTGKRICVTADGDMFALCNCCG